MPRAKDGDTAAAAAMILTEVLPLDVIVNIFLRLPFITILTLRRVNKFCREVTSTPDFVKSHIKLSAQDVNLSSYEFFQIRRFTGQTETVITRFSTTFLNNGMPPLHGFPWKNSHYPNCVTLGSSKDLICTVKYNKCFELWNPSSRVHHQLSPLEYDIPPFKYKHLHTSLTFGFGYHDSTNDHKVVAIIRYRYRMDSDEDRTKTPVIRVCSLKKNYWRTVDDPSGLSSKLSRLTHEHSTTPVCGKIHWMERTMGRREIVSFDLGKEVFGKVEPPDFVRNAKCYLHITWGVLNGCLCMVSLARGDLWVMKEYGVEDSWTIVANIPIKRIPSPIMLVPCYVLPNSQILFATEHRFWLYDPKDNSLTDPKETKWDACCAYDRESNSRDFMCLKLNFTCLQ